MEKSQQHPTNSSTAQKIKFKIWQVCLCATLFFASLSPVKLFAQYTTNAKLADLQLSAGTLHPAFAAAKTNYAVGVYHNQMTITVTPITEISGETVTVNGAPVTSGSPSAPITLNVGSNLVTVVVTAINGVNQKTYSVTVTRAASGNTNLSSLYTNAGVLSPTFDRSVTTYTEKVSNKISSIIITAAPADSDAQVRIFGSYAISGATFDMLGLNVGDNVFPIVVTAQNGDTKTYTLTITRAHSGDATLSYLFLNDIVVRPTFAPAITTYNTTAANVTTSTKVFVYPNAPDATATVNGSPVNPGVGSAPIDLNVGVNTISIVVTSGLGTTKTYTVNVTRAKSPDDNLFNLLVSAGSLNPVFDHGTTAYSVVVPHSTSTFSVKPFAISSATITVNGSPATSAAWSSPISLSDGSNPVTIEVTAENGAVKDYNINVTRAVAHDADLSDLQLTESTISPAFNADSLSYTAAVTRDIQYAHVAGFTADPNATVSINGEKLSSGTFLPLFLGQGANLTGVVVKGPLGDTKSYTLIIVKPGDPGFVVNSLQLSNGTLSPAFDSSVTNYTANVDSTVASITVTATDAGNVGTMYINNSSVSSGTTSNPINLSPGANYISVVVTDAGSGATKTYLVTVNKAGTQGGGLGGPFNSIYQPVSVAKQPDRPVYAEATIAVRPAVSPNGDGVNDFLVIDGISNYPDNQLSIVSSNGEPVFEAKGYDNSSKVFDGHSSKTGKLQQSGTYFYSLTYKVNGEIRHKTGYILLKY